jgi:hypothetical protein
VYFSFHHSDSIDVVMPELNNLVSKVTKLNGHAPRKVAAFIGAVTGDAAALHLEWIYDQEKLANIIGSNDPAFWQDSHCPFYTLPTGKVSCYADQAIQALTVMSDNGGVFDADKTCRHFLEHFGNPASPYRVAEAKRYKDKKYPVEGPWIHGSVRGMVDRYNADIRPPGPDDAREHDGLDVALPLMIQQAPNYDASALAQAINIMTQDPWSVNHHEAEAFMIGQFIHGEDDPIGKTKEKFEDNTDIVKEIEAVEQGKNEGQDAKVLVKKFGMACPMPGSFQSSLVSIIGAKSYHDALRETIACGGDACSRANLIGACLGAKYGIEGIPIHWLAKVDGIESLIENAIKVFCQ